MHDKNGTPIKVGDTVTLECVVTKTVAGEFCTTDLETVEAMPGNGTKNCISAINAAQVLLTKKAVAVMLFIAVCLGGSMLSAVEPTVKRDQYGATIPKDGYDVYNRVARDNRPGDLTEDEYKYIRDNMPTGDGLRGLTTRELEALDPWYRDSYEGPDKIDASQKEFIAKVNPSAVAKADKIELADGWHQGPLPPKTYWWGAVVLTNNLPTSGFYFADFKGDHVILHGGDRKGKKVDADQIQYWNNSIRLPVIEPKQAAADGPTFKNALGTEGKGQGIVLTESGWTQLVGDTAKPAKDRPTLRRAALRTVLNLKAIRATGKDKAAIRKVLDTPEMFDSLLDGLSADYDSQAGGVVQDFLTWLTENWSTVLQMILSIISIFADENMTALPPESPFTLASHGTAYEADCGCPAEACKCTAGRTCGRLQACQTRRERLCRGRPRCVGKIVQRLSKTVGAYVLPRAVIRRSCCVE